MAAPSLTLYDHVGDLIELLEESEAAAPETREQYAALIRAQIANTRDKVDRIAAVLATLETSAEACTAEIERLQRRRQSLMNNAERLKQYVLEVMMKNGMKKLEGQTAALTMRANSPGVDIIDEAAIPAEYQVQTISTRPDKRAIKAAVLGGTHVPGAKLVQSLSLLRR
jgi:chromosome segregation ATPase